jgi:hypothetical protein
MKITPNNKDIETALRAKFYPPATKTIKSYRARITAHIASLPASIQRIAKLFSILATVTPLLVHAHVFV